MATKQYLDKHGRWSGKAPQVGDGGEITFRFCLSELMTIYPHDFLLQNKLLPHFSRPGLQWVILWATKDFKNGCTVFNLKNFQEAYFFYLYPSSMPLTFPIIEAPLTDEVARKRWAGRSAMRSFPGTPNLRFWHTSYTPKYTGTELHKRIPGPLTSENTPGADVLKIPEFRLEPHIAVNPSLLLEGLKLDSPERVVSECKFPL